ncbi:PucR family transcriptional regulator [Leekyejoonella antrihumi]|uniref:PucR family transcriptional regulator n=1 Tax=Leekyejoonella antrihumi TaxID=1660198 RepID=A0A563E822_9MICO|nr:PucR family transcriptional regulator [Leekyejoonella antrihumi]TWP38595.1 PucR family transcriptional regulator [Leekyejoonella antrihumi]
MPALTVADVLRMPMVRSAGPRVLAGGDGLRRTVRWVHTTELADIAPLLRGGDLVLTTGIALPDSDDDLRAFAMSLGDSEAAGLLIELGRRWSQVPHALAQACDQLAMPLVALTREARFASIAQAVGERIVDEQLAELREAQRVHDTFTELSIAEAGPREILEAVQRLSGAAVVLENEEHRVLDYRAGPGDITDFLADWQIRSRRVHLEGRTSWDQASGWLVTRLGRKGRGWGRLVVQTPTEPPQRLIATAERAAAALALHRLHDRHRDSLARRTHHELLVALLLDPTDPELLRRCDLAGLPTVKRKFIGLTLRPRVSTGGRARLPDGFVDEVIASVVRGAHRMRVPALVCEIDRDIRVLIAIPPTADSVRAAENLAKSIAHRREVIVAAGRAAVQAGEIDRTLREAQHVAESVTRETTDRAVHWLEDVHLRGLLTLLADDDRLQLFVGRELDALKAHDAREGSRLLDAIWALLQHPGSKSEAAASIHLSRPAFYDRLAKAERLLGVDLDDPDIRVSLHVALLADQRSSPDPAESQS